MPWKYSTFGFIFIIRRWQTPENTRTHQRNMINNALTIWIRHFSRKLYRQCKMTRRNYIAATAAKRQRRIYFDTKILFGGMNVCYHKTEQVLLNVRYVTIFVRHTTRTTLTHNCRLYSLPRKQTNSFLIWFCCDFFSAMWRWRGVCVSRRFFFYMVWTLLLMYASNWNECVQCRDSVKSGIVELQKVSAILFNWTRILTFSNIFIANSENNSTSIIWLLILEIVIFFSMNSNWVLRRNRTQFYIRECHILTRQPLCHCRMCQNINKYYRQQASQHQSLALYTNFWFIPSLIWCNMLAVKDNVTYRNPIYGQLIIGPPGKCN